MSEEFEAIYTAFMNNRVPDRWHKCGYNSLKSLGSWVHDLILRVDYVEVYFFFYLSNKIRLGWIIIKELAACNAVLL